MRRVLLLLSALILFQSSRAQNTALGFDGANDYVSTAAYVVPTSGDFTVEFWALTSTYSGFREFLSQGSSGTAFYIGTIAGTGEIRGGDTWLATGAIMPLNQWVHIALVKSGDAAALYLNGVQKASLASGYSISAAGSPFRVGLQYGGIGEFFNGRLEELRVWSMARTAAQIKAGMYGTVAANTAGLVACYKMNEGSGTTLSNSTATTGFDGTLTGGPVWVSSPVQAAGNALAFDGNDYVEVPYASTLDKTNALSIEAWVYPTADNWMNLVMKGDYGYGFSLSGSAGLDGCNVGNKLVYWDQNDCGSAIRSSLAYTQNAWHHVAVTVEDIGTQLEIYFYLDGVQDGPYYSSLSSISNGGASSNLFIGRQGSTCACNYVTGSLDELRIWNTVRTPAEIQTYKDVSLTGSEAGLAGLYSFNQGIASGDNTGLVTAIDGTSNNNHGSLTGFALSGSSSNWVDHASLMVLPVRLTEFKASSVDGGILLQWTTGSEENSQAFVVERSGEGRTFNPIGTVVASGESGASINYSFEDRQPLENLNYYRLKIVDRDGRTSYSQTVAIKTGLAGKNLIAFPNPVENELQVQTSLKGNLAFFIYDASGRMVKERHLRSAGTSQAFAINVQDLKRGVYWLKVQTESGSESISFMKK